MPYISIDEFRWTVIGFNTVDDIDTFDTVDDIDTLDAVNTFDTSMLWIISMLSIL